MVDKDRAEGTAEKIKGFVKETAGKITGNHETEAEGKAQKGQGEVQKDVGKAKDKARDALDK